MVNELQAAVLIVLGRVAREGSVKNRARMRQGVLQPASWYQGHLRMANPRCHHSCVYLLVLVAGVSEVVSNLVAGSRLPSAISRLHKRMYQARSANSR